MGGHGGGHGGAIRRRRGTAGSRAGLVRVARIALALYLLGGAAITLGPRPGRLFGTGNRAARDLTDGALSAVAIEAGANVALFVPAGFLLCLSFPGVRRWLLWGLCVAASAGIELYQYAFPDRDASARDLVMNTLGATLGVALAWAVARAVRLARTRRGAPPEARGRVRSPHRG